MARNAKTWTLGEPSKLTFVVQNKFIPRDQTRLVMTHECAWRNEVQVRAALEDLLGYQRGCCATAGEMLAEAESRGLLSRVR